MIHTYLRYRTSSDPAVKASDDIHLGILGPSCREAQPRAEEETRFRRKGETLVAVGKSLRPLVDLAVLGLVLGGAVLVWNMASSNRELVAKLQLTTPLVERTNVRDRLVGTSVSLSSFDLDRPDAAGAHLLWIVDLARCRTCLNARVAVWNALGDDTSLKRHVVVFGDDDVPVEARRALRGTTFTIASRQDLEAAFGPLLPNTKLLVDGAGVVVMADSRTAASDCGWSFEAQVGALRGTLTAGLIRTQPLNP